MQYDNLYKMRHSAAHVLAQAVLDYFPEAKLGIGPPIDNGFYYDFDLPRPLTPEDLEKIEARMRELIKEGYSFDRREVSPDEARALFVDQPYKLELIRDLLKGEVDDNGNPVEGAPVILSTYRDGDFEDLCRGPHVPSTADINPDGLKLLNTAGAYWRGNSERPMLQRVYGTSWPSKQELDDYLWRVEEARKRDNRKLGKELGLFVISDEVGSGLPLWTPKGARIRQVIEKFITEEQEKRGYQHVYTPHIGKKQLWMTSGHWDLYRDKMYSPMDIDGIEYLAKPMNCPMHMMIYRSEWHSYKDMPVRIAENATVYRYEQSGELAGMLRVRGFTQDDAHIFCRPDQVKDEFLQVLDQALYQFRVFGFTDLEMWLSVRDPRNKKKYLGDDAVWDQAEQGIEEALNAAGQTFIRAEGEAKFYGPALDIMIKDALGRKWQCTTIQVDFMLPERFGLEYIDADGQAKRPVVLHRAPLGSLERFFGILIEHYAGAFPLWLAPVQAVVIPVTDKHQSYAVEVASRLKAAGMRVEADMRSERMNAKIRDAQMQKTPYMLVVGGREMENGTVSVRTRNNEDRGAQPLDQFIAHATELINSKSQDL